jgi:hypothetical protein
MREGAGSHGGQITQLCLSDHEEQDACRLCGQDEISAKHVWPVVIGTFQFPYVRMHICVTKIDSGDGPMFLDSD